jgi:hypothetical protein
MTRSISVALLSLWLANDAGATISTPLLLGTPSPFPERSLSCLISNTSSYPRKGKLVFLDLDGNPIETHAYDLAGGASTGFFLTDDSGLVRCAVVGAGSAGEAGIRAVLCNLTPNLETYQTCLEAR